MNPLIALHITLMTLSRTARSAAADRLAALTDGRRDAGLSTLEIAVIALGLFLIAGAAVLALTNATNNRLNQIR